MNRVCFRATVTFRLKLRLSQTKTWLARDTLGGEGLVMGVAHPIRGHRAARPASRKLSNLSTFPSGNMRKCVGQVRAYAERGSRGEASTAASSP